jgi:hypothetical protein
LGFVFRPLVVDVAKSPVIVDIEWCFSAPSILLAALHIFESTGIFGLLTCFRSDKQDMVCFFAEENLHTVKQKTY